MATTTFNSRRNQAKFRLYVLGLLVSLGGILPGCTSVHDYVANGFKVGPNYQEPPAPVAKDLIKDWEGDKEWSDTVLKRVRREDDDLSKWWTVFRDPVLDQLICHVYNQNLTLRQAAYQVLAARAQLGGAIGSFLPQSQYASGSFARNDNSTETAFSAFIPKRFYGQFEYSFNLSWELDFWGKFRRAIESSKATLDASVFNYDDVLVTMLSDVATNYVQLRVYEERIRYAKENVELQKKAVERIEQRQKVQVAKVLDVNQARSILYQTAATIPELEIGLRTTNNQLCILLGVPPEELRKKLGPPRDPKNPIPSTPPEMAVKVSFPADLVRRRPDVRAAERKAAAQCAQIGYAESDFYPHISIVGTIGYSAEKFRNLFNQDALTGGIGPSFQWNILNYARIINNVRVQDATFQQLVAQYQNTVLTAQQEVENGLVMFLKAQRRADDQGLCVKYAEEASKAILAQYEVGNIDISQVILILQNLAIQQDTLAQAKGEIPTGLIQVYKALGGGWQLREMGCDMPGGRHFEDDPLRKKSHFLPYPRVLKESALPVMNQPYPAQEIPVAPQPTYIPMMEQSADLGIIRLPDPRPMMEIGVPQVEPMNQDESRAPIPLPMSGPVPE
jgi:NodT family efflux transporter outer membrane factor (OMF) lipoprotein